MKGWLKRILAALILLGLLGASWILYQVYDINRTWRSASAVPADAAIILGAAVWEGKPSPALRERLDVAVSVHQQRLVKRFICTGGVGLDPRSEASVCAEYLQAKGVSAEIILLDEQSLSTFENLTYARAMMQLEGLETALIVTHGFHLKRALMQAQDLGIPASGAPVTIRPINELYLTLREVAAITYFHLGGRERSALTGRVELDR